MADYKIGITEAGDAGLDLSWAIKISKVNGVVAITKRIGAINGMFSRVLLDNKDKIILHCTVTGWGGTVIEPYVPKTDEQLTNLMNLVNAGFPMSHVVIRVDPIIATEEGLDVAKSIITWGIGSGFLRYRISLLDVYPHVVKRFNELGIKLPYTNFIPPDDIIEKVDKMILDIKTNASIADLRIETCAEPWLKEAIQCGCISEFDLSLFGLNISNYVIDSHGYQRKNCLCYSGKTELLTHKKQCPHGCLYCYWR